MIVIGTFVWWLFPTEFHIFPWFFPSRVTPTVDFIRVELPQLRHYLTLVWLWNSKKDVLSSSLVERLVLCPQQGYSFRV